MFAVPLPGQYPAGRQPPAGALVLAATLLAALLFGGCRADRTPLPYNVILVSIDTLRADHLGCYGYEPPTSEHIDAFRRDAVLFSRAIAHAPSTLASHASMLTSRLPVHHGGSFGHGTRVTEDATTLAEVLSAAGYVTASFNNGGQLAVAYGLDQGFDLYEENPDVRMSAIVESTLEWLDQRSEQPFFLFLHSYQVHHPYTPQAKHVERFNPDYEGTLPASNISIALLDRINRGEVALQPGDLEHVVATYDAEIFQMDRAFGWLIEELRARGLYDDTLIVFTSDHGEEFGEHGGVGRHSHSLFDELLWVPLLVKLPQSRAAGETVASQVPLLDIAPTVLEVVDLSPPRSFDGHSLLRQLEAGSTEPEPHPVVSQMDTGTAFSLRTPRWKLIRHALYDLESDPREAWDVSSQYPEVGEQLAREREHRIEERAAPAPVAVETDDETRRQLRALGYVG